MSNRDFAAHYRSAVGPRLRQACRFRGLMVACGDSYADAIATVTEEAWRLGGGRLPTRLWDPDAPNSKGDGSTGAWINAWDRLCAQLDAWLLESIEAVLPEWDAATALAERVAIDVGRCIRAGGLVG